MDEITQAYQRLASAVVLESARKAASGDLTEIRWLASEKALPFLDFAGVTRREAIRTALDAILGHPRTTKKRRGASR